jgi:uncharacterized membrane protein
MRNLAAYAFAAFFVVAGINHFVMPEFYLKIIPPALPAHELINALSGIAEVIIGVMVALPRTRVVGGWLAIALLVAVFPANIYLYMNQALLPQVSPAMHLLRLPLQALFIAWAYWAAALHSPVVTHQTDNRVS